MAAGPRIREIHRWLRGWMRKGRKYLPLMRARKYSVVDVTDVLDMYIGSCKTGHSLHTRLEPPIAELASMYVR